MAYIIRKLSSKSKELTPLTSSLESNQDTINNQEIIIFEIENKLYKWNVLKIPIQKIYKIDFFDFFQYYIIKSCKQNLNITFSFKKNSK